MALRATGVMVTSAGRAGRVRSYVIRPASGRALLGEEQAMVACLPQRCLKTNWTALFYRQATSPRTPHAPRRRLTVQDRAGQAPRGGCETYRSLHRSYETHRSDLFRAASSTLASTG